VRTEKELLIVQVLDKQRNFGRAASILNMTQPALSRALQRIESDLGVILFDRSKTHVACLMTFRGSAARVEPPSGTSYMPDGGGGRIVIGLVQAGPF
jgi:hypothetical protein